MWIRRRLDTARILCICYASSLPTICIFFAYITHNPCVWYPYSSCVFFAYVTHHPCLRYAYSLHILLIILVYDIRILRTCCAYSHALRIILRMICIFFAYVTHHPCVWCAYSSCMSRISSRMLRVFFMHVTYWCYAYYPICATDGGYSPIPSNLSTKCSYDALLKC